MLRHRLILTVATVALVALTLAPSPGPGVRTSAAAVAKKTASERSATAAQVAAAGKSTSAENPASAEKSATDEGAASGEDAGTADRKAGKDSASARAADDADASEAVPFDVPPRPIDGTMVAPVYPEACREQGLTGRVLLEVTLSERGAVIATEAKETVEACPAFTDAAVAAMVQWKFEPATLEGKPVQVTIVVPFQFALD